MASPTELSAEFLDAYNRRDAETMCSMMAPEITYIRPGPTRFHGVEAIMERYGVDWERHDTHNVIREVIEVDDTAVMEITIVYGDGGSEEVEGVVIHRWAGDRLVSYRLYMDGR